MLARHAVGDLVRGSPAAGWGRVEAGTGKCFDPIVGNWDPISDYLQDPRPLRLPAGGFTHRMASEAEGLRWLGAVSRYVLTKASADGAAAGGGPAAQVDTRIFVEGRLIQKDFMPFAVRPGETSFAAYARRVSAALNGERFGIAVNDVQVAAPELLPRARALADVYKRFEGNRDLARVTAFLGNNPSTAFGVHLDRHHRHVLQYVVTGKKRMRFWSGEFVAGNPRARAAFLTESDYAPFLPDSIAIDARAGDWICWPGTYWHVGEGIDEQPHYALSFVFERLATYTLEKIAARSFLRGIESLCGAAPHADAFPDGDVPADMIAAFVNEVRAGMATQQFVDDVTAKILSEWLSKTSGGNFRWHPEAQVNIRLGLDTRVTLAEDAALVSVPLGDELLYAANGKCWTIPYSTGLARFVRKLAAAPEPVSARDAAAACGATTEEIKEVINNLAAVLALEIAPR